MKNLLLLGCRQRSAVFTGCRYQAAVDEQVILGAHAGRFAGGSANQQARQFVMLTTSFERKGENGKIKQRCLPFP